VFVNKSINVISSFDVIQFVQRNSILCSINELSSITTCICEVVYHAVSKMESLDRLPNAVVEVMLVLGLDESSDIDCSVNICWLEISLAVAAEVRWV